MTSSRSPLILLVALALLVAVGSNRFAEGSGSPRRRCS